MMCTHKFLDLPDGLPCSREHHPESPGDHTYTASAGPDLGAGDEQ